MIVSPITSLALSILVSFLFPFCLYLWPCSLQRDRASPATIRRNFITVLVVCLISSWLTISFRHSIQDDQDKSIWQLLNFKHYPTGAQFVWIVLIAPLLHAFLLFATSVYVEHFQDDYGGFSLPARSIISVRDYIHAPLAEEFLYRGILLALLLPCFPVWLCITISSLLFGLMHTHKIVVNYLVTKNLTKEDITQAYFQMTYTTIFGVYSSIVYLSTGHIASPILLHCFCNLNGVPDLNKLMENKWDWISLATIAGVVVWLVILVMTAFRLQ